MEAIDQNPVVYEFFTEVSMSEQILSPQSWVPDYAMRRYGRVHSEESAFLAWEILLSNAYSGVVNCTSYGGPHCLRRSIITVKPTAAMSQSTDIEAAPMVRVWELLHEANGSSAAWRYDLIDTGRQVIHLIS